MRTDLCVLPWKAMTCCAHGTHHLMWLSLRQPNLCTGQAVAHPHSKLGQCPVFLWLLRPCFNTHFCFCLPALLLSLVPLPILLKRYVCLKTFTVSKTSYGIIFSRFFKADYSFIGNAFSVILPKCSSGGLKICKAKQTKKLHGFAYLPYLLYFHVATFLYKYRFWYFLYQRLIERQCGVSGYTLCFRVE